MQPGFAKGNIQEGSSEHSSPHCISQAPSKVTFNIPNLHYYSPIH